MVDFEENGCEMRFISGIPESDDKKEMIKYYSIYWAAQLVAHYIITQDSSSRNTMSFARLNSLYYLASRELFFKTGEYLVVENDLFMFDDADSYLFSDLLDNSLRNIGSMEFINASLSSKLFANIPLVFYDRFNDTVFTVINKLPEYDMLSLKSLEAIDQTIEKYKKEPLYMLIREIKDLPEYKDSAKLGYFDIRYDAKFSPHSRVIALKDYVLEKG